MQKSRRLKSSTFWVLLKKELILEWRQKYALGGIFLYVGATTFTAFSAFIRIPPNVWTPLYWIIVLFASVNAIAKSFQQESGYRQLYYYQLTDPATILAAKMVYNIGLLLTVNLLTFLLLSIFSDFPVKDLVLFFGIWLLGSLAFSIAFTFVSSIASKATNSATLMAILSFPTIIPVILTLNKLTATALRLMQDTAIEKDFLILGAISLILAAVSFILFPFVWKE